MGIETGVTRLFAALDQSATLLSEQEDMAYLEGVIRTGTFIVEQEVPEPYKKKLVSFLAPFWEGALTQEEIRRAFQLVVLKGLKTTGQAHYQVTPDAVALFMGYLVNELPLKMEDNPTILDLAVGSANLLTAVLNQLPREVQGIGVDVDDLMIQLSFTNANLQQTDLELFHQDAFGPLLVDPVDVAVIDLPVGHYPDEEIAKSFQVASDNGKAYSHHLMIEQSVRYLKPGGYGLYIIPNQLFEEDKDKKVYHFIQKEAVILGLLQLPATLFKTKEHARSILLLQKQGEGVETPKQALLAQLPSFSNKEALSKVLGQIHAWFQEKNVNS
jgi:site-specific DNA-methyltransferase (adenine-specific)